MVAALTGLNVKDIAAAAVALETTGASRGRGVAPEGQMLGRLAILTVIEALRV